MSWTIVIVGTVVLALVYFFIRSKGSDPAERAAAARPAKPRETSAFHAVSIHFESGACSAAKSLEGEKFLSNAAPRIPLPDCDASTCECRFIHHEDRRERDTDDRRNPYRAGMAAETGQHKVDQRHGARDRRGDRPKKI